MLAFAFTVNGLFGKSAFIQHRQVAMDDCYKVVLVMLRREIHHSPRWTKAYCLRLWTSDILCTLIPSRTLDIGVNPSAQSARGDGDLPLPSDLDTILGRFRLLIFFISYHMKQGRALVLTHRHPKALDCRIYCSYWVSWHPKPIYHHHWDQRYLGVE
jgi:hypothetical protein